jgi:hypothetical protein
MAAEELREAQLDEEAGDDDPGAAVGGAPPRPQGVRASGLCAFVLRLRTSLLIAAASFSSQGFYDASSTPRVVVIRAPACIASGIFETWPWRRGQRDPAACVSGTAIVACADVLAALSPPSTPAAPRTCLRLTAACLRC